jgi:hypothetical protein
MHLRVIIALCLVTGVYFTEIGSKWMTVDKINLNIGLNTSEDYAKADKENTLHYYTHACG